MAPHTHPNARRHLRLRLATLPRRATALACALLVAAGASSIPITGVGTTRATVTPCSSLGTGAIAPAAGASGISGAGSAPSADTPVALLAGLSPAVARAQEATPSDATASPGTTDPSGGPATPAAFEEAAYAQDVFDAYAYHFGDTGGLWNDVLSDSELWGYPELAQRVEDSGFARFALGVTTWATQGDGLLATLAGASDTDDATDRYYLTALTCLLLTLQGEDIADTEVQANADALKSPDELAFEGISSAFGAATGFVGIGAGSYIIGAANTAVSLGSSIYGTIGDLATATGLTATRDCYLDVLQLAQLSSDEHLVRAASTLASAVEGCYQYRLDALGDLAGNVASEGGGWLLDVLGEVVQTNPDLFSSDELSAFGTIAAFSLPGSFDTGAGLGVAVGDAVVDGQNTLLRYYETRTLGSLRATLVSQIDALRQQIAGPQDLDEIRGASNLARLLLRVDARGSWCVYSLVTSGGGTYGWLSRAFDATGASDAESWYASCRSVLRSASAIIDQLNPDPSLYAPEGDAAGEPAEGDDAAGAAGTDGAPGEAGGSTGPDASGTADGTATGATAIDASDADTSEIARAREQLEAALAAAGCVRPTYLWCTDFDNDGDFEAFALTSTERCGWKDGGVAHGQLWFAATGETPFVIDEDVVGAHPNGTNGDGDFYQGPNHAYLVLPYVVHADDGSIADTYRKIYTVQDNQPVLASVE